MFVLVVQNGKYQGKRIKIPEREIVIGRDETAGVRIGSDDVSRLHCRLTATSNGLLVRDLGSRNGTFVDGVPIGNTAEFLLRPGGTLTVGPMTFQLVVPGIRRPVPLEADDRHAGSLSDDDIATWLAEGDTSELMSAADTTIVTGRETASPTPPIVPAKRREFKSVADEAADIIRRHQETLKERGAAEPGG
jgi:pSer/pThr/pTyr-binding forkhead associated (FHA) protein